MFSIADIIKTVGITVDELFTSDEERLRALLDEKRIDADLLLGQLGVNAQEAQHSSVFVAGWRPFIGWVGGLALAYQFLAYPILIWVWTILQSQGVVAGVDPPPVFEAGPLFAIITGMLGIGGMRSYDKLKNTDTKRMG